MTFFLNFDEKNVMLSLISVSKLMSKFHDLNRISFRYKQIFFIFSRPFQDVRLKAFKSLVLVGDEQFFLMPLDEKLSFIPDEKVFDCSKKVG